jgi:pimeloyl-ACP methyl ester carboxylesterase
MQRTRTAHPGEGELLVKIDVDALKSILTNDPELALAARFWTATVVLECGDDEGYTVTFDDGQVVDFERGRSGEPGTVTLSASSDAWERLLQPVPEPFWQDPLLGVSIMLGQMRVEGDLVADVFPYYAAIQRLTMLLREHVNGGSIGVPKTVPKVARLYDSPVGRYIYVDVDDVQYRVYYEEAGEGIPVLCHHTAGSDGRQYRHFLEDEELQKKFRMIAYDLPYHGKSIPPTSKEWWTEEYKLTQDFLLKFVPAFSKALGLDRPVFMGCSVGGFLAPDLALHRSDDFRAVIGLNSGVYLGPSDPRMSEGNINPRVTSGWKASAMMGIMAPGTTEAYRREVAWCYAQGAPPVFTGDLHYYNIEHDLRGQLDKIDTSKTAVYIVAGEYDPSMLGDMGSKAVADGIEGAHFVVAKQGGHFLMSENPEGFREIIHPILEEIAAG